MEARMISSVFTARLQRIFAFQSYESIRTSTVFKFVVMGNIQHHASEVRPVFSNQILSMLVLNGSLAAGSSVLTLQFTLCVIFLLFFVFEFTVSTVKANGTVTITVFRSRTFAFIGTEGNPTIRKGTNNIAFYLAMASFGR
jgi:hypothetical protein